MLLLLFRPFGSAAPVVVVEDTHDGFKRDRDFKEIESCVCPSAGACCTMGTANTMCCLTEALGMSLPTNGTQGAVRSSLLRLARAAGRRIMDLVAKDIRPGAILTANPETPWRSMPHQGLNQCRFTFPALPVNWARTPLTYGAVSRKRSPPGRHHRRSAYTMRFDFVGASAS
jgi:hypothetical protein